MEQCRGGCSHEMVKSPATAATMAYPLEEERRRSRGREDLESLEHGNGEDKDCGENDRVSDIERTNESVSRDRDSVLTSNRHFTCSISYHRSLPDDEKSSSTITTNSERVRGLPFSEERKPNERRSRKQSQPRKAVGCELETEDEEQPTIFTSEPPKEKRSFERGIDAGEESAIGNWKESSLEGLAEEPVEEQIEEPVERPVEEPVEGPVEGPIEGPVEGGPIEGPVEGGPIEGPVEGGPIEGPVEGGPIEGPVEGRVEGDPGEGPAKDPGEESVERSLAPKLLKCRMCPDDAPASRSSTYKPYHTKASLTLHRLWRHDKSEKSEKSERKRRKSSTKVSDSEISHYASLSSITLKATVFTNPGYDYRR
ncbi:hypothetical protein HZH68_008449 [Vespula germanica]|uniref:Uncharacterized protein n=1 Tax=Vespula germanica TaxID=30212 RepID=A0A834K0S1_VESGE|nr:hypothetical protein HZH68_008449 [Vespula germanica]